MGLAQERRGDCNQTAEYDNKSDFHLRLPSFALLNRLTGSRSFVFIDILALFPRYAVQESSSCGFEKPTAISRTVAGTWCQVPFSAAKTSP